MKAILIIGGLAAYLYGMKRYDATSSQAWMYVIMAGFVGFCAGVALLVS